MTEEEQQEITHRAGLALLELNDLITVPPEAGEAVQALLEAAISSGHEELGRLSTPSAAAREIADALLGSLPVAGKTIFGPADWQKSVDAIASAIEAKDALLATIEKVSRARIADWRRNYEEQRARADAAEAQLAEKEAEIKRIRYLVPKLEKDLGRQVQNTEVQMRAQDEAYKKLDAMMKRAKTAEAQRDKAAEALKNLCRDGEKVRKVLADNNVNGPQFRDIGIGFVQTLNHANAALSEIEKGETK